MIYLDNAATTLRKPPQVAQAVLQALETAGNSSRGTHGSALAAAHTVYAAREALARLLGCPRPDHVVFTPHATGALNLAINGLFSAGDHVISTDFEHNSVLRPLYRLQTEQHVALDFLPSDEHGRLQYKLLPSLLQPGTKAIVCTNASNLTGNLVDLERMAAFAREHGLLLIVDAAQTAGARPLDMDRLGIDVLCFTGHKALMGPQGTGGLCLREGLELRPLIVGGTGVQSYSPTQPVELPAHLEAGTLNTHGIAGLLAAVQFIESVGVSAIAEREAALTCHFYEGVRSLPHVTVYGDFSGDRAPIVSLNIAHWDAGTVADILAEEYGIAIRSGAHCAPRMHRALGTDRQGAVRFSFSYFTTEEEIDTAIQAVSEIASEL